MRSSLSRVRSAGRGFTLIELIVIVSIIAVIGVVSIAAAGSTYQSKQRLGAQLLVRHLTFVRERAIATGNRTWVTLNTSTDTATYQETVGGSLTSIIDPARGTQLSTALNTASEGQFLTGVEIGAINGSASATTIGFDWLGRPLNNAGTVLSTATTITVTAQQGSKTYSAITITIQPETGLVSTTW